jgi:acyl-CoA synthetase (AMP-forming)/AMP-acid ligase II
MTQATDYLARPFGTLSDVLRIHAAERPDAVALIKDDDSLSYAGLEILIDRIVRAFSGAHIDPGDSIAICALSSIEYAATFLAGLRAGIAVAPLAPSSTPTAIAEMVADCGAKLLFIDAVVGTALAHTPLACPLISFDDSSFGLKFSTWLTDAPATPVADAVIEPKTPFNIIYSSGTTGTPKGIVQSHKMRWSHINRGASQGYGPHSVTLLSTPLYSNTTLVSFFPTLALGGCAVLMDKFDVARYLMLAEKHRVTHTMLVPVQYRRLMEYPEFDRFDLASFEMKFCTSAPFSAALKSDILARWPGGLIEFYGMTEGGGGCALMAHQFPDKLHTVGKPMFGADVRLIDEDGHEVPTGTTGEIVGRSPAVMNGYWNRPDKTAETVWLDADGNAFIRTGDVGRFDEDGFLTLMDRKKDMIISGGFNIYPSDLEAVILQHPDVSDVGVVGVPSDNWGETPVAFVIASGGDTQEIRSWANARLGKTQRLAAVVIVDSLPRSAIGKLLKRELRDSYS